ncbi:MAG: GNAT family N-acetyltransferase [Treponema sp.]|nr:GNAT family N-acetyltransferase [Treponema sp.]
MIFYEKFVEISSFYILQEFRKKGLGKQTFDFIKNLAAAKPLVLWVLKENTAARNFYEKVGMHFTNKTRVIKRGSDFVQYMYSTSF